MTELIIILGLILLNGFFSMSEIALISSRKSKLDSMIMKGDEKAKRALKIAEEPGKFLSTIQIGITLIGILTGVLSGNKIKSAIAQLLSNIEWLAPYSYSIAIVLVVLFITYLTLVLGELVPKRIGLSAPERVAKLVTPTMQVFMKITYPFIAILTHSSNVLIKLFHIKENTNQVTEEEIKAIINEGTEQGTLEEAEQEIIERVLHLGDRNITSLMTHRSDVVWFDVNDTPDDVKNDTLERGKAYSIYPLCDGNIDEIRGVVFLKDIFRSTPSTRLYDLVKPAFYIPENITAYLLMEKFKTLNIHYAFIVDEYGTFQGIVTLNDIMEAIIGDMASQNEYQFDILKRDDGTFLIDGQISFYEFLEYFDITDLFSEDEGEFDTLAGFMLHHFEHIPAEGESVSWYGFKFEIMDMDNHRIDKILVTPPEKGL